jgi:hypothetical protein
LFPASCFNDHDPCVPCIQVPHVAHLASVAPCPCMPLCTVMPTLVVVRGNTSCNVQTRVATRECVQTLVFTSVSTLANTRESPRGSPIGCCCHVLLACPCAGARRGRAPTEGEGQRRAARETAGLSMVRGSRNCVLLDRTARSVIGAFCEKFWKVSALS